MVESLQKQEGNASKSEPPGTARIDINSDRLNRNLLLYCILFEIFLVFIDAFINYGRWIDIGPIRRLCNIAREDGLASWFMTAQTLMAGVTLWFIFVLNRSQSTSRKTLAGWGLLAAFFTYMAADDGAEIHERIGSTFKAVVRDGASEESLPSLGTRLLEIFPSYAWQLVLLPFFGLLGLFMLIFLWNKINPRTSRRILVVASICFVTAVGLDFIEGLDKDHALNLHTWLEDYVYNDSSAIRHFSKSLEEFMEMVGMTLLWSIFLKHFASSAGRSLNINFRNGRRT